MAEKNCVTFIWKIGNLHSTENSLESPKFYVRALRESEWTLLIDIPSSLSEEIIVYLHNYSFKNVGKSFCIYCEMSIVAANPQKSNTCGGRHLIHIQPGNSYQVSNYPTWMDISETMRSEFLPQGYLTVQCRLWNQFANLPYPLNYHAFSSMGTQITSFTWYVNDFKSVEDGDKKKYLFYAGYDHPTFSIRTFIIGKKEIMEIVIQQTNKAFSKLSLTCKVSVLDSKRNIAIQEKSSHDLKVGKEWIFPRFFSKEFLISKREDYLRQNRLILLFEFTYIASKRYSAMESISNLPTSDDSTISKTVDTDEKVSCVCEPTPTSNPLKDDLFDLYKLNSFSDITIHGQERSFPCHKCILSARSPVFLSLFSQSTIEYTIDLDTSTLGTLLQFIYTGDLENELDYQTALKLYKAAGQYQIVSLKQICSEHLEKSVTDQNVCDLLLLASKLQDMELKKKAEDFILTNLSNVLRSNRWREIVKSSSELIVDSLHRIFLVEMNQFDYSYIVPIYTNSITYDDSKSSMEYKSNLLSIFKSSLFSDFQLQSNGECFNVHKNILWARSPIFKAMFSTKTEEIKTNVLKVTDLDQDTIKRMLLFVYSGDIEDLEYPEICKLYNAAVKYDIFSMKDLCSKLLVKVLSVENVSTILMLADQHEDKRLKNVVLDFVSKNDESIILSPEWKNFMKNESKLASEALFEVYAKKLHRNKSSSELESNIEKTEDLDFFRSDASSILEEDLLCLYMENFQSDFTLCTGKGSFQVHKNILSAMSPVFKAMFSSNLKETTASTLNVPDIDEQTLAQMLRFVYCGSRVRRIRRSL